MHPEQREIALQEPTEVVFTQKMKHTLIFLTLTCLAATANAEYLFGTATSTNRLTLATNEAIIVSDVSDGLDGSGGTDYGVRAQFYSGGTTNVVVIKNAFHGNQLMIGGPAQFSIVPSPSVTNQTVMMSFRRLTNSPVRTRVMAPGADFMLTVLSNQSVRVFAPLNRMFTQVTTPTGTVLSNPLRGNEEFEGPATIRFIANENSGFFSGVSYYINESSVSYPNLGALRGPTGKFEIVVEKSSDLVTWTPVIGHVTSDVGPNFYKFHFSH